MKSVSQFCRSHPIIVWCVISATLAIGITELFFVDLIHATFKEKLDAEYIAFHFIVLIAIPLLPWLAVKATKPAALILAASLIFGVPKAQAAPLVIGGLLIVVIGGVGIVGCKIAKRCNKIAKKHERGLTNEQFIVAGESDSYAALLMWSEEGYCPAERLLPSVPTVFTMSSQFNGKTAVRADRGYEFTETWSDFEKEVSDHDLFLSRPVSYSKNGHRCEPEQSPISFSTNRVVRVGVGGLLVAIERSSDMKTWTPVVSLNIEPWMRVRCEEASDDDQQFYRVTTKEP